MGRCPPARRPCRESASGLRAVSGDECDIITFLHAGGSHVCRKNIRLPIDRPADDAYSEAARRAGLPQGRRRVCLPPALDARRERPSFVYTIGFPGDMPAGGPDVSPVAEYEPPAVSSCAGAGPRPSWPASARPGFSARICSPAPGFARFCS